MKRVWRDLASVFGLALAIRVGIAVLIRDPGYMDTAYYSAGAVHIAQGGGLTEPFIWNYLDAVSKENLPKKPISPYVQEHVDLIWAIRTGNPIVEAENTAISTLTAIMGRTSAYTGKEVTWEEMLNSNETIGPAPEDLGVR